MAQPTIAVPIVAQLGGFTAQIGTLTLALGGEPDVQIDPEQLRLAETTLRAIIDGP